MKRIKFYWIYKHKIGKGVHDDMRTVTIFVNPAIQNVTFNSTNDFLPSFWGAAVYWCGRPTAALSEMQTDTICSQMPGNTHHKQ